MDRKDVERATMNGFLKAVILLAAVAFAVATLIDNLPH